MNIQGWTKKGSAIVVNTPADLKKFKIGLMRGAKAPEALIAGLKIEDAQSANSMELLSKNAGWRAF